jgi:ABC-type spermidine/putrescine transport system permease subunit II
MFTRNTCAPRLVGWFQRLMHAGTEAAGLCGAGVTSVVVEVVVVAAVVPGVVGLGLVATVVSFDTAALVFLLSPVPRISNAARKPTAIASTATSHVFEPRRSIAAAR